MQDLNREFVDGVGQVKDFKPAFAQQFHLREPFNRRRVFAGRDVNFLLEVGHTRNVFGERRKFAVVRRLEQEQVFQAVLDLCIEHAVVYADFERLAELVPKFFVLGAIIFEHLAELTENIFFQRLADNFDFGALLKDFAGNIQRQVGRINQPFGETQIFGQEVFALVHNEHVARIQLQAGFVVGVVKIVGGVLGYAKQRGVFEGAFRLDVEDFKRCLPLVKLLLKKFVVVFARDFGLVARPERLHGIDRANFNRRLVLFLALDFKAHLDGIAHEVGIFFDKAFELINVGEVVFALAAEFGLEVQNDGRAVRIFVAVFDFVFARAVRSPLDGLRGARLAREDFNFFGDDERGIKAHAELTDEFLRGGV